MLALIALVCAGATLGLLMRALVLPRAQADARVREIGAYGFAAALPAGATAVPAPSGSRPLIGAVTRLGDLIARQVGPVREEKLRSELLAAGVYGMPPRALLGSSLVCALLFPLAGATYDISSPILKLALIALLARIGWGAPLFIVRRRARTRLQAIDRALPDLIDLLVVTVEAGLGFSGSLQVAAGRMTGPLGDELRLTLQEHKMGRALRESLEQMLARADTPAMRSFVRAVTQGEALGVSIGSILRGLSVEMRRRRRQIAEERAQKAPVKMLFPLVFLIFPALGIVLLAPAAISILDSLKDL
jgi:tight adherence protein C